jgi:hypothetical protein
MGVEQSAERAVWFFVSAAAQNLGAMSRGHCGAVNGSQSLRQSAADVAFLHSFESASAPQTHKQCHWLSSAARHLTSTSRALSDGRVGVGGGRGGVLSLTVPVAGPDE